jgi:hypothetical protein
MAKKANRRKSRVWSKADERDLKAHSRAKTPVAKISKMTKRTIGALKRKAGKLGLALGHRRKSRVWSKADERDLKAHSRAKTPVAKISKMTKRTIGALRRKAGKLGLALGHRR